MGTHSGYQPLVTGLGTHKAETSFAYYSRAASNKEKKIEKRIGTQPGYHPMVAGQGTHNAKVSFAYCSRDASEIRDNVYPLWVPTLDTNH